MHLCALQGTEQLGGTTLISLYDSLFYPLTPDLRCIHHTGLQGRLGPGFRKELPPFCPSLCNVLRAYYSPSLPFSCIYVASWKVCLSSL